MSKLNLCKQFAYVQLVNRQEIIMYELKNGGGRKKGKKKTCKWSVPYCLVVMFWWLYHEKPKPCHNWCIVKFHSLHLQNANSTICTQNQNTGLDVKTQNLTAFRLGKLCFWFASCTTLSFLHMTHQVKRWHIFFSFDLQVWAHFVKDFMMFNWCLSAALWFLLNYLDFIYGNI